MPHIGDHRMGLPAIAALILGLLCACSGGSSKPTSSLPSAAATQPGVSPSVAPSPSPTAADLALAAYKAMWADTVQASRTSDTTSPLLARDATGTALAQIVQSLYTAKHKGLVAHGQIVVSPVVTKIDTSTAIARASIKDCADTSHWLLYNAKSGKKADNSPGGRRRVTATVAGLNGTWKVADFQVGEIGSC